MASVPQADRHRALDLGSDDWAWLYELAFWLGPDGAADPAPLVPEAQAVLIDLLSKGLVEVATFDCQTGGYSALDAGAGLAVVSDPDSWRTASDLVEQGSDVLFAYGATDTGRRVYFGAL